MRHRNPELAKGWGQIATPLHLDFRRQTENQLRQRQAPDYFHLTWLKVIYIYIILSATIDDGGCGAGTQMEGSEMIVEMSEKIGQLKIEPYEKIVRLIITTSDVIQCFTDSTMTKMRYKA